MTGDEPSLVEKINRPKDWVDIEAMMQAGSLDLDAVVATLDRLLGEDPRIDRLEALR